MSKIIFSDDFDYLRKKGEFKYAIGIYLEKTGFKSALQFSPHENGVTALIPGLMIKCEFAAKNRQPDNATLGRITGKNEKDAAKALLSVLLNPASYYQEPTSQASIYYFGEHWGRSVPVDVIVMSRNDLTQRSEVEDIFRHSAPCP